LGRVELVLGFSAGSFLFTKFTLESVEVSLVLTDFLVVHAILRELIVLRFDFFIGRAVCKKSLFLGFLFSVKAVQVGLEGSKGLALLSLHQSNLFSEHGNLSSK